MTTTAKIDFEAALADPAAAFAEPKDVVAHQGLSREAKIKLLRQWERDAQALSVAENEGMGGGEEKKRICWAAFFARLPR